MRITCVKFVDSQSLVYALLMSRRFGPQRCRQDGSRAKNGGRRNVGVEDWFCPALTRGRPGTESPFEAFVSVLHTFRKLNPISTIPILAKLIASTRDGC
jgi:hypothetical protein